MKKEFYTPPYLELHRFQIERPFCDSYGGDPTEDFDLIDPGTITWDEELFI